MRLTVEDSEDVSPPAFAPIPNTWILKPPRALPLCLAVTATSNATFSGALNANSPVPNADETRAFGIASETPAIIAVRVLATNACSSFSSTVISSAMTALPFHHRRSGLASKSAGGAIANSKLNIPFLVSNVPLTCAAFCSWPCGRRLGLPCLLAIRSHRHRPAPWPSQYRDAQRTETACQRLSIFA